MPILPIMYAVSLVLCFGGGYYYGWAGEYAEVVKLESTLEQIHQASTQLLKEKQQQVETIKANQETTILELEKRYHDQITTNDSLHDQLVTAQRMHRASHPARSCNVLPKTGNSTRSKADAVREPELETNTVSTELDSYLSNNAVNIDRLDQDKHFLLNWINTIPKDLIQ